MCQCPLGLIPHCYAGLYVREAVIEVSMPSRAYTSLLPQKGRKDKYAINVGVNALSGLYLIVTVDITNAGNGEKGVSMPSRAYTSLLLQLRQKLS